MNLTSRRAALRGASALSAVGLLAACTQTTNSNGQTTLTVTLAGAQAEAQAVLNAFEAALANVTSAQTYLAAAKTAVADFQAATSNWRSIAESVVAALVAVEPLVNLTGPAGLAVNLALVFIQAFINGIPTVVVPASVARPPSITPTLRAGAPAAPIVIPALAAKVAK
jgi:glutathione S-transferase